jgi:hypothetical protein
VIDEVTGINLLRKEGGESQRSDNNDTTQPATTRILSQSKYDKEGQLTKLKTVISTWHINCAR